MCLGSRFAECRSEQACVATLWPEPPVGPESCVDGLRRRSRDRRGPCIADFRCRPCVGYRLYIAGSRRRPRTGCGPHIVGWRCGPCTGRGLHVAGWRCRPRIACWRCESPIQREPSMAGWWHRPKLLAELGRGTAKPRVWELRYRSEQANVLWVKCKSDQVHVHCLKQGSDQRGVLQAGQVDCDLLSTFSMSSSSLSIAITLQRWWGTLKNLWFSSLKLYDAAWLIFVVVRISRTPNNDIGCLGTCWGNSCRSTNPSWESPILAGSSGALRFQREVLFKLGLVEFYGKKLTVFPMQLMLSCTTKYSLVHEHIVVPRWSCHLLFHREN